MTAPRKISTAVARWSSSMAGANGMAWEVYTQWWPSDVKKNMSFDFGKVCPLVFLVEPSPCFFLWTYMIYAFTAIYLDKAMPASWQSKRNIVCLYVLNDMMSYCEVSWASGKWKVLVRDSAPAIRVLPVCPDDFVRSPKVQKALEAQCRICMFATIGMLWPDIFGKFDGCLASNDQNN